MKPLVLLMLLFCWASTAAAQTTAEEPLILPFADLPPFSFFDDDGQRSGFLVDLGEEISAEIGVPVDYLDVANSREFIQAQVSGRSTFIPGILGLPQLSGTSELSDVVATDRLYPAVLSERMDLIEEGALVGRRIGIVPPAAGSNDPLLDSNVAVEFDDPQTAFFALLTGRLDALLVPTPVVYGIAREAGVEGRLHFIGPPVQEAERYVALHESRADLLPQINAAIAKLEADGRLEALRLRYNITVPAPPPEVLKVAIAHFPPNVVISADGDVSGFAAEVFEGIARRALLDFEFEVVSPEDYFTVAQLGQADVVPYVIVAFDDVAQGLYLTRDINRAAFGALVRQTETRFETFDDLKSARIGMLPDLVDFAIQNGFEEADLVPFQSIDSLLDALGTGEIDAIMEISVGFEAEGITDRFRVLGLADIEIPSAIGLRPGLAEIRDKLDAVIPAYLLSDDFRALQQTYFGEPEFWTRARVIWSMVGAGAALVLAGVLAGVLNVRQNQRATEAMRVVRNELEAVFNATTSGIVALNAGGQIIRINDQARHLLGGLSKDPPIDWPENVTLLDAETLKPLEHSADPIQRALAGNDLRSEIHLMRKPTSGDEQRYVRINNTTVKDAEETIRTVLVMDDVSQEERNRQVVERGNRLDALGQLTGGIAHDFNNLLASLVYAIDTARRTDDAERRTKQLELAMGALKRGRSLTARLLAFAKKQPSNAQSKSTSEALAEFQDLVNPMIEAQIELIIEEVDEGLTHRCDPVQLETALLNLTLNARDAILRSSRGNRIEIGARAVRSQSIELENRQADEGIPSTEGHSFRYVEFSVTDNGPGMDEVTLSRCTDPFFTTKDTNSGTGLGLAMVYGFVRQSDGELRIYSEEGVGTTVRIILPRGVIGGGREMRVPDDTSPRGGGQIVLAVEDDPTLLAALKDMLLELGYRVLTADSGMEALELISSDAKVDLLLTDVVMPGSFGGFELARLARQKRPDLPVLYSSGYTGFSIDEMGAIPAPVVQKPAAPQELAQAIHLALQTGVDSSPDGAS